MVGSGGGGVGTAVLTCLTVVSEEGESEEMGEQAMDAGEGAFERVLETVWEVKL